MHRTKIVRTTIALLAIAFFAAPVLAAILGVSAEKFENRRLAQPPKLSQGWDAFQAATRYLVDRMPLRAQAVRANTSIWTHMLATDPRYGAQATLAQDQALPFAGTVDQRSGVVEDPSARSSANANAQAKARAAAAGYGVTGHDDWRYFQDELIAACDTTISDELALERWARLVSLVERGGHPTVMLVPPDKASVYPEHLPEKYPFDDCAPEGKERLWSLLADEGPGVGVRELRSDLLRRKAYAGDDLFNRADSHWSTLGALTLLDAVLDGVGEGVRRKPGEIVDRRRVTYVGDLGSAGGSEPDKTVELDIRRPRHAPRIPGRTLMICDSFAYKWTKLLEPYFENVRIALWSESGERLARAIRHSDTVILEAAERFFKQRAADDAGVPAISEALQTMQEHADR